MNETWVKLYRKISDHEVIRDSHAVQVFVWVLTKVDRESGSFKTGRYVGAAQLGLKPITFYKTLSRLEKKYKVITQASNNQFTTIKLLNWAKYQPSNIMVTHDGNNQVTTKEQPSNNQVTHIQDIENRELRIEKGITPPFKKISYLINIPLEDIQELNEKYICTDRQIKAKAEQLYDYCHAKGKVYKDYKAFLRNALSKDFGERIPQYNSAPQDLPDIPEEQRLKNIAMIRDRMKEVFKDKIVN